MKTEKEIEVKVQEDIQFIISAVTSELHMTAYLEYFNTWERNGGMQWFFDECVQITHEIMLSEGSKYLEWLEYWKKNDENYCKGFSEVTNETCFDWYHMNKALEVFKSRYDKDTPTEIKERYKEHIGGVLSLFQEEDMKELIS